MPNNLKGATMAVHSIGIESKNIDDLIGQVKKGLPVSAFNALTRKLNVSDHFLSKIVNIPQRTLNRRRQEGRFKAEESERVLRIARLYDKALDVFEDERAAKEWLKSPARGLGGAVPLEYADTELGAQEVENLLVRIEFGVFPG